MIVVRSIDYFIVKKLEHCAFFAFFASPTRAYQSIINLGWWVGEGEFGGRHFRCHFRSKAEIFSALESSFYCYSHSRFAMLEVFIPCHGLQSLHAI